jgi:hypothetical protein
MMGPQKRDRPEMKKPDAMTRIWIPLAGLGFLLLLWLMFRRD